MNCCNCICPRARRNVGPTGPQGPIGPTGPTGPTGPAGTLAVEPVADFYNISSSAVAQNGTIPLTDNVNLTTANVTHATGSSDVTLVTTGYYLISYSGDVTSTAGGNVILKVNANGSTVQQSLSTATVSSNGTASLSSSFIYDNTVANNVLTLVNGSDDQVTVNNVNFVVRKLN